MGLHMRKYRRRHLRGEAVRCRSRRLSCRRGDQTQVEVSKISRRMKPLDVLADPEEDHQRNRYGNAALQGVQEDVAQVHGEARRPMMLDASRMWSSRSSATL
eukprot:gene1167-biopygen948